jgi:Mg2+ and Co2+ transporter CorA
MFITQDLLEDQIKADAKSLHAHHLRELESATFAIRLFLFQVANTFWPALKEHTVDPPSETNFLQKTTRKNGKMSVTPGVLTSKGYTEGVMEQLKASLHDFEELSTDLIGMYNTFGITSKRIEKLAVTLETAQQNNMNSTLYVLTWVTSLSIPLSFATGMFGMNFTNMSELDPSTGPGYALFWYIIIALLVVMVYCVLRYRLLDHASRS